MAEKKGYNRRDFLKILGASSGVAAAGCGKELPEKLIPYVVQPNELIPGVAAWYAATCGECSAGCGVLVRTREGRAVKVEGNPAHPVNRGGLCAIGQSSLQGLYDPDRVREPLKRGTAGAFAAVDWKTASGELAKQVAAAAKTGKETVFVTRRLGTSERALFDSLSKNIKGLSYVEYEVLGAEAVETATRNLLGDGLQTHFDFAKADVVLGVGADYLETWVSPVSFTKGFSSRRRPRYTAGKKASISKVIHVEPRMSLTAANADMWLTNRPGSEHRILQALLVELVQGNYTVSSGARAQLKSAMPKTSVSSLLEGSAVSEEQLKEIAAALAGAGRSLVVAGGSAVSGEQAVLCAELALALNYLLGNLGETVQLLPTSRRHPGGYAGLQAASERFASGAVSTVVFVDVNPVYSLPKASAFAENVAKVPLVVSLSTQLDETAMLSHFVLPGLTSFESWNDSEPLPGMFSLNQPAMQPVYEGLSLGDLLIALATDAALKIELDEGVVSFADYIKKQWKTRYGATGFEERWLTVVERGGDWQSPAASRRGMSVRVGASLFEQAPIAPANELTLIAFPTVRHGDGSAANRPWVHEIPDPLTTSVWGSWVELHPTQAERLKLAHGDVVRVRSAYGSVEAPVFVTTHIDAQTVGMPLGLGHDGFGRYASGVGANPIEILAATKEALSLLVTKVSLEKTISRETLVTLQGHDSQLDRGLQRTVAAAALVGPHGADHGHGDHGHGHGDEHGTSSGKYGLKPLAHHDPKALGPQHEAPQMFKQMEHVQYRWGMSVDLASCTGCSACVTACYAENNIPVVGKEQCNKGREMAWLRIERYLDGPATAPVTAFSPVMCQHCNNAPCEPVCPVYATYHNEEGINTMVYNRCVGTRYCSNNCSYKVRRFNWFKYDWPEPLTWQLNPDVTVRSVGVMEKCSFCVQRIKEAQNKAKDLGRSVLDGEVQPACASSCPADAIAFGNLKDESSVVYKNSQDERSYRMLQVELNTQPSVYYMAKVVHEEAEHKDSSH